MPSTRPDASARALGDRNEAGVESRFTADELDLLGAERDGQGLGTLIRAFPAILARG
ncbi:hypothetical protein ACIHJG_39345 [Streptomyces sp. NPDC052415]|uniref:hypothetical protein n=1 Tax=Streptomyces sp. NPDC052415 TaxID=3365690 RepID=UPI0037CEA7BE